MAMDDIFDGIDEILEQAQKNGEDVATDSDTDTGTTHDYMDDDGQEIESDGYDDIPEEEPDEDAAPMDEEEILMNHQNASLDWKEKVDQGVTDLDEKDYVMQVTGCTEEEFENRDQIIHGLILDVAEVIDYDEIPEDVLATIAGLSADAQTQLAEDIKNGKILPEHLTRPFVLGYERQAEAAQDPEEDEPVEETTSEETTEPYSNTSKESEDSLEDDEFEKEFDDTVSESSQPSEDESTNPQAYVPQAEETDDDFLQEEEPQVEESVSEPEPKDSAFPTEEDAPTEEAVEPERTESMSDTQPVSQPESVEEPTPQEKPSAQIPERRGFMSERDFETLFETFEQCKPLIRETAGSAVTEADYRGMMTDMQEIGTKLSNVANYYLDNALYPFSFDSKD